MHRLHNLQGGSRRTLAISVLLVAITLPLLILQGAVFAQGAASTGTPSPTGVPLPRVLDRMSRTVGILIVSDSTLSQERLPADPDTRDLSAVSPVSDEASAEALERRIEQRLDALVKTLPPGTIWAKLYLPVRGASASAAKADTPTATRLPAWKGDDVAAYAFAQARLLGGVGAPTPPGMVEVLGQRVPRQKLRTTLSELNLTPVYLVTNLKRGAGMGAEPWSPLSRAQWSQLPPADRKIFGQQQAMDIMALPPEERARVLEQMKQQDRFFDSIKDPLEKMLGHDL